MRRLATLVAIVSLASAESPKAASVEVSSATQQPNGHPHPAFLTASTNLSFPGGGTILFRVQNGPGFAVTGTGMLSTDGSLTEVAGSGESFAYWDPGRGDRGLLVVQQDRDSEIRALAIDAGHVTVTGRWTADDGLFASFSRDGRWIAEVPFDRQGRLRTGDVVITDRASGRSHILRLDGELTLSVLVSRQAVAGIALERRGIRLRRPAHRARGTTHWPDGRPRMGELGLLVSER
jgi:hypothetical protein